MAWTYISSMDEYDKEVQKDRATPGRWTFNRYMYFKPDQYENWSKKMSYSGVPYSAELINHPSIPSANTYLTGPLSAFYVSDIISVNNLSEEEHGDACSYGVVTIEYENKPGNSSNSGGEGTSTQKGTKPWERPVDDFSIVSQESQIPFIKGKEGTGNTIVPVATTAGQVLYDFTTSLYCQRLTWTYYCLPGETFGMTEPLVNSSSYTLFSVFTIAPGCGLLLPPGYKRMWYYEDGSSTGTRYSAWSFEIVVNPKGWDLEFYNVGTKFKKNNQLLDICSWYVFDPAQPTQPVRSYGDFNDMIAAKKQVDTFNKGKPDNQKKFWSGGQVTDKVPLTAAGAIDTGAIGTPNILTRTFHKFEKGSWHLGTR